MFRFNFFGRRKGVSDKQSDSKDEKHASSWSEYPGKDSEKARERSLSTTVLLSPLKFSSDRSRQLSIVGKPTSYPQLTTTQQELNSYPTQELADSKEAENLKKSILEYLKINESGNIDFSILEKKEWEFLKQIENMKKNTENYKFIEDYVSCMNKNMKWDVLYQKYFSINAKYSLNIDDSIIKGLREIAKENPSITRTENLKQYLKETILPLVIDLITLNLRLVNSQIVNEAYQAIVQSKGVIKTYP